MPTIAAAVITGVFSILAVALGIWWRGRNKYGAQLRRSLNRQEAMENYVFALRRQVHAVGKKPHPWPVELHYLNRDDSDQLEDSE